MYNDVDVGRECYLILWEELGFNFGLSGRVVCMIYVGLVLWFLSWFWWWWWVYVVWSLWWEWRDGCGWWDEWGNLRLIFFGFVCCRVWECELRLRVIVVYFGWYFFKFWWFVCDCYVLGFGRDFWVDLSDFFYVLWVFYWIGKGCGFWVIFEGLLFGLCWVYNWWYGFVI